MIDRIPESNNNESPAIYFFGGIQPASAANNCPVPILLESQDGGGESRRWVDCHNWRCRRCREQFLVPNWQEHARDVFADQDAIFVKTVPHSGWRNFARKIRRAGGDYFRVAVGDRVWFFCDLPMPGSWQADPDEVQREFEKASDQLITNPPRRIARKRLSHPISVSHGWRAGSQVGNTRGAA